MNFTFKTQTLNHLLKQRNFASLMAFGLLLVSFFLSLQVLRQEERWILMPQFDTDHRLELSSSTYSDSYLIDWAASLTADLFTVNPETVDYKTKRFLEVTGQAYGGFEELLKQKAKTLKEEGISTVFYPKTFKIQKKDQKVFVKGTFLTFFGKDRNPIFEDKEFVLTYSRGPKGVILVEHLKEEKHA